MTKNEFMSLLEDALETAAGNAEQELAHEVSRRFQILLYGGGYSGVLLKPAAAVDILYLGKDRFYRILDVAVVEVDKETTTIFIRASDHRPGTWEQTWNDPVGSGPFKQLIPTDIKTSEDFYLD
jgi:hypothetical protein